MPPVTVKRQLLTACAIRVKQNGLHNGQIAAILEEYKRTIAELEEGTLPATNALTTFNQRAAAARDAAK